MKTLNFFNNRCSILYFEFSIILELLVILIILKSVFKLTFKGALNVNLTHLLCVAMLPQPNFFPVKSKAFR